MKKFLTAALSLSLVAGACLGMTGCKPSTDEVANKMFETACATNYTTESKSTKTYAKEAVTATSEEQSWEASTKNVSFDYASLTVAVTESTETYAFVDGAGVSVTENDETYIFVQSNRYFKVTKNNDELTATEKPWNIKEYEQKYSGYSDLGYYVEGFMSAINEYSYGSESVSQVADVLKTWGDMVEWNKDIEKYELTMGLYSYQANILDDDAGVYVCTVSQSSRTKTETTVTNVGTTVVAIPDAVKTAVATWITEHPVEA